MKLPITEIILGTRRRTDPGDIQSLANSIETYGLLHPVVVDEQSKRLVAGGRRLAACELLGWFYVPVTYLAALTDQQLREVELEENLRRKDLTEIEKSRQMTELAEIKAEELRDSGKQLMPESGNNLGGRPEKADSQQKVAEAIGVPRQTLQEAQQHVAAITNYPALEALPKYQAIQTARELDKLPKVEKFSPEYESRMAVLEKQIEAETIQRNIEKAFHTVIDRTMFMFLGNYTGEMIVQYLLENPSRTPENIAEHVSDAIQCLTYIKVAALQSNKIRRVK